MNESRIGSRGGSRRGSDLADDLHVFEASQDDREDSGQDADQINLRRGRGLGWQE